MKWVMRRLCCVVSLSRSYSKNVEGDQLGSWVMRINYENEDFMAAVYADKFFEDHSSMFQLDYDGYGSGDEWDVRKDHKYLLYDFKDWMLGAEVKLQKVRTLV